ncbi:hypothetical protein PC39_10832 [Salinisphaera sp. PC39]|uniref:SIMPL domain-containing protein n=1 Tax=Salinisphaera sp. PC39 TaxID=1304156 RepID=UPI0033418EC3
MPNSNLSATLLGGLIAVGLAAAGYFVADAAQAIRASERVVEVKGLAEREVPADLVLWSLSYGATADDLSVLNQRLAADTESVRDFLRERGFEDAEISRGEPNITDRHAGYGEPRGERYQAQAVILVRTDKVDRVKAAQQETQSLVAEGVTLNRNYEYPTEYLFTRLNEIKPEMIAEATRSAREAAQQFAEDSGSEVGGIRRARQGYFSIEDRDRLSPHIKRVRVVTTVEYHLID